MRTLAIKGAELASPSMGFVNSVAASGGEGRPPAPVLGAAPSPDRAIEAKELSGLVAKDHVT